MLIIDTHVPLPVVNTRQKYPFAKMQVGDSFAVADERGARNARAAAGMFARRNEGTAFTCRKTEGGWRLWRVS